MRRALFIPLILSALVASSALAPLAHAQTTPPDLSIGGNPTPSNPTAGLPSDVLPTNQTGTGGNTTAPSSLLGGGGANIAAGGNGSGQPNPLGPASGSEAAYDYIMAKIMSLFAWLLGVAAILLDYAAFYTVVQMGALLGGASGLSAVGTTWSVLRNIGNIVIIFGFLAVAFTIILDVDWYGGGAKMLPKLLIAALLLNFSLFIAESIIDVGNLFATEFYTQIRGGQLVAPNASSNPLTSIQQEGISNAIMSQLGLQSIYNSQVGVAPNTSIFAAGNSWIIGFMAILLFIVAAFVMFSLAFMLIARFVVLIFLIIVAPIGFAGFAIPWMSSIASRWWNALVMQTLTAPVLMLMLYIALRVILDPHFLSGFGATNQGLNPASAWVGYLNPGSSALGAFASLLLSFVVAMGLLLAVTVVARSLGAAGANAATRMGGKLTFGLTGYLARNTAGRLSAGGARGWRRTRLARVPILGTGVARVLDYGGNASFDGRVALNQLPKSYKIDAGKPQKGGYNAEVKAGIKAHEDYAKTLKPTRAERTAQGDAKTAVAEQERVISTLEDTQRQELREQLKKQGTEMAPLTDDVTKASAAFNTAQEAARTNKDEKLKEPLAKDLDDKRAELTNALRARDQKTDDHRRVQDELRDIHQESLKTERGILTARQKELQDLNVKPQDTYAAGLAGGLLPFTQVNKTAVENIKKEARKKQSDKDLEAVREFLAKRDEGADKAKEEKKAEKDED